ncbi:MAG: DUF1905 domain-containing protein [Fimbriimonadaceae bacterium]|nr:DUF1905 domain-containing protein [Fimbriimonadaceae bacterium]
MSKAATEIRFSATLHRPVTTESDVSWTFLNLPKEASDKLSSRGMMSVEGTFNGSSFVTTLLPDGEGGHWMKVDQKLREAAGAKPGDVIELKIAPVAKEPEPEVPEDVLAALEAAGSVAMETWRSITPIARRDWIFWIVSGKKAETRIKRIQVACDKLSKGNRRPCCFDRSGMYDKSLSSPVAEEV